MGLRRLRRWWWRLLEWAYYGPRFRRIVAAHQREFWPPADADEQEAMRWMLAGRRGW
jgi:hypothetical protein